jgi:polar amino acid transport system permease protein
MEVLVKYLPSLAFSAGITLLLFLGPAVIGSLLGLLVAVMRTARGVLPRQASRLFILIIQGTPALLLLFIVHYGVATMGVRLTPFLSATIALSLYAAGFLGEIWRGAIEAVPRPQWEAAKSLGFGRTQTLMLLIAPQAIWIAMPATVGFLVSLMKVTSLAAIIGVVELTKSGMVIANLSFQPMMVYGLIAVLYFAMCWPMSVLSRHLEKAQHATR